MRSTVGHMCVLECRLDMVVPVAKGAGCGQRGARAVGGRVLACCCSWAAAARARAAAVLAGRAHSD